jgi:plastocyanin
MLWVPALSGRQEVSKLVYAAVGVAVAVFVSACAPATAAPASAPTPPAASPAVSPVPSSAALPAPTPGGAQPTVVGRAIAVPSAAPAVVASPSAVPVAAQVNITAAPAFDPAAISISRGQAVQWTNMDRAPETVTDDPARVSNSNSAALPPGAQPWDSGVLNTGQSFTYIFSTPGTYTYTSLPGELRGLIGHITVSN